LLMKEKREKTEKTDRGEKIGRKDWEMKRHSSKREGGRAWEWEGA